MMRSALFALAVALPAIAAAQDTADQTGSINRTDPARVLTEQGVRDRLTRAGYTAIGSIDGSPSYASNEATPRYR